LSDRPEYGGGELADLVRRALEEDVPSGDLTTDLTVLPGARCRAELRAKAHGILAGTTAAQMAFQLAAEQTGLGPVNVDWKHADGTTERLLGHATRR